MYTLFPYTTLFRARAFQAMRAFFCRRAAPRQKAPPSGAASRRRSVGAFFWRGYKRSLGWALAHGRFMMLLLAATIGLNFYLYAVVPKGFFPQQDTGQLLGFFRVDQGTSFHAMRPKLDGFRKTLMQDPAIESVTGFVGGRGGSNSSFMMIQLKPLPSAMP